MPDFGGHEHVVARHAARGERLADRLLVLVAGGRVDMPVPGVESRAHRTDAFIVGGLPCAQTQPGNQGSVSGNCLQRRRRMKRKCHRESVFGIPRLLLPCHNTARRSIFSMRKVTRDFSRRKGTCKGTTARATTSACFPAAANHWRSA